MRNGRRGVAGGFGSDAKWSAGVAEGFGSDAKWSAMGRRGLRKRCEVVSEGL